MTISSDSPRPSANNFQAGYVMYNEKKIFFPGLGSGIVDRFRPLVEMVSGPVI